MSISSAVKQEVIKEFRRNDSDTGSPEVQIAVLTKRIETLTTHFQQHSKDHASRRGLLMLVSRRRRLLRFLQQTDPDCYLNMIQKLGLRK
jgi:small subunit ribosomal protein S15